MSDQILKSPLRYPGSKSALVPYIRNFIKENKLTGKRYIEPFAGGASVAFNLLHSESVSHATLIEKDPLVYAFWKSLKRNPSKLCRRIWDIDVTLSTWKKCQKYLLHRSTSDYEDITELGLVGLYLNRVNFSGIISATPIGGKTQKSSEYKIDCRFNKERIIDSICQLAKFRDRFSVCFGDAISYLKLNEKKIQKNKSLVYIDPPYYQQGKKLYRHHYLDDDHKELAHYLNNARFNWLVSYDNHDFIKQLFTGNKIMPFDFKYTVRQARRVEELLITNMKILPQVEISVKQAEAASHYY